MPHLVLIGDSVFDNHAYTRGAPDVAAHLRAVLPADWKSALVALDGTTTQDMGKQLTRIPKEATHLVLSLGGNDALAAAHLLDMPVRSTGQALDLFREAVDDFSVSHGHVLDALVRGGVRLLVCTIYNGNFEGNEGRRAPTATRMWNDAIAQEALVRSLDVVELRSVCDEAEDFANPIEPSGQGGEKIARAIAAAVGAVRGRSCRVY